MQNLGWAYSLIPAIKKLYTKKEDQAAALERHMEFFNTHPYVAAPIIGVTLALEEERANGAAIDDAAIQGVKIGMMGPLAVSEIQSSGLQFVQFLELLVHHLLRLVTSLALHLLYRMECDSYGLLVVHARTWLQSRF